MAAISNHAASATSTDSTPTLPPPTAAVLKERKVIDRICSTIDLEVKQKNLKSRIYAEVGTMMKDSNSEWKIFKDEKELEKGCDPGKFGGCYTYATLYSKAGKPVLAAMEFTRPSGDWITYVDYYLRADGKVMKNHSDLRRFGALPLAELEKQQKDPNYELQGFLVQVIRDRYYDAKGGLILAPPPKYINMDTKMEVPEPNYMEGECPLLQSAAELPFHKLLSISEIKK